MRGPLLAGFGFTLLCIAFAEKKRYDGYKLVEVAVPQEEGWLVMSKLQGPEFDADVWQEPNDRRAGQTATFMLAPDKFEPAMQYLDSMRIKHSTLVEDMQLMLEMSYIENEAAQDDPDATRWTSYHQYDDIMNWVNDVVTRCGSRCSHFSIGNSFEGRELRVVKITGTPGPSKERLWIDATIHAREWIAPAVAQYLIERLANDYDSDPDVKEILDKYDVYIEPVVNPDGYVYSWTDDRLWRKGRQDHAPGTCIDMGAADINRNFNHNFNGHEEFNPCSQTYPGPAANSEPEAKAINDFILQPLVNWAMFMTLHSYSQLWMTPWGYTDERPPNYDELMRVGSAGVNALYDVNGTFYRLGQASEILYFSYGTSRDWAAGVPQIPYVYTLELRPASGNPGFLLPPEEILPSVLETWAGFKAAVKAIINPSK